MSIDTFLLSTFARKFKFTPNITSIRQRYLIICIIVTSILISLIAVVYELFMRIHSSGKDNSIYFITCITFSILSFTSIHKGNEKLAAILTICCLDVEYLIGCIYKGISLATIAAISFFPNCSILLGFSNRMTLINVSVCLVEFGYYFYDVH